MKAYLFVSGADEMISALTTDQTGATLPTAYAPWRPGNGGTSLFIGGDGDFVGHAIQRDGFYLLKPDAP